MQERADLERLCEGESMWSQKEDYLVELEAQLAECGGRIERLEQDASALGIKGDIEYEAQVIRARRWCDQLSEKPAELRACGREGWPDLRATVESARVELIGAVQQAERYVSARAAAANGEGAAGADHSGS